MTVDLPYAECSGLRLALKGPLASSEEISAAILAIEKEAEGALDGLLKGATHGA
jgi:hypothetical protein